MPPPGGSEVDLVPCQELKVPCERQGYIANRISSPFNSGHAGRSVLGQELSSPPGESSLCSISTRSSAPICRQFWKSGNYDDALSSKSSLPKGTNYLHIHPKFLHSNATSHKWAFGAIAELIDNAVDEVQNGATHVTVDKTLNPKDGSTALLIRDNGGGMDPSAMRRCLSFGFSDKDSKVAIGQYGNGFKTSSMRLGSDVIVFTRHLKNRILTQSIGLLSYTFLMQTGHDRIVVPVVDYEFNDKTNSWNALNSVQNKSSNLTLLFQWSPYSSEQKLLEQFDDIGNHGTKIIVYNLWLNNDGNMELDFESDSEDIRIYGGDIRNEKGASKMTLSEEHLANRLRFSLRAYLSILYLRVPENFCILLRGRQVEYYNIASNLKFRECILYRPQSGAGYREGEVITTIGFLKEAPQVNIHGFNVYHKNRLILPFWHVVSYAGSRGRGVVGVLEANFIEPTHNKQDFERTSVFQKLEQRLKEMTVEYWDYHCGLVGYQIQKKPRMMTSVTTQDLIHDRALYQPLYLSKRPSPVVPLKRKEHNELLQPAQQKRNLGKTGNDVHSRSATENELNSQEAASIIDENEKLKARCSEHESIVKDMTLKVARLKLELSETLSVYSRLLAESKTLEKIKEEKPLV